MKKKLIVTFICLLHFLTLPADVSSQPGLNLANHSVVNINISDVGRDVSHVLSSPFRLSKSDGIKVLLVGVTTASLVLFFDASIDRELVVAPGGLFWPANKLADIGQIYDDITIPYFLAGLVTSFTIAGLISNESKSLQTVRFLIEAFFLANAFTAVGKFTLGRSRPYTGKGSHDFNLFKFGSREFRSMPSGHATSAFSMMTVIAKQYPHWWVQLPAYTLGLSVVLQRIESRSHWMSDVLLGSSIGYWVANTLTNNNKNSKTNLYPYFWGPRLGVVFTF